MLIQYTTVTQCLALMHWRCIVLLCQFHCVHESQAKHDPPDLLLRPGFFLFLPPQRRNIEAGSPEAHFQEFKTRRKQEVQVWLNDLCFFLSMCQGFVNTNNSVARSLLTNVASPRSELVYFRHQAASGWLKCKPRGPLSVSNMHKCKVVLGDGCLVCV